MSGYHLAIHWDHLCNDQRALAFILPTGSLTLAYVFILRFSPAQLFPVSSVTLAMITGPWPMFAYVAFLSTFVGFAAGIGVYIAWEHVSFMRKVSKLTVDPYSLLTGEANLTDLADFTLIITLLWFVAVALTTVVLLQTIDIISILIYLAAASAGLILFFVPEWYLHELLVRSKMHLTEAASSRSSAKGISPTARSSRCGFVGPVESDSRS